MKIESSDQDIRTLLTAGYYQIPRFQRPYSWDRENIQEFWNDIVQDSPSNYFIGSMVVYKSGSQRFGVVDGQQRLTTITIMLCVLRNALRKNGFIDLAKGVHNLVERANIDNKQEYVLSAESSYPYFQTQIQCYDSTSVQSYNIKEEANLKIAYDTLTANLAGIEKATLGSEAKKSTASIDEFKKQIIRMRDSLLNLKVILVKLENEDDAYVIFETLNTRGKDLSLKDLVKTHLTKLIKGANSKSDEAKMRWDKILQTIEGSVAELDTDTYLHHYWLSKYEYLPSKSLYKSLKVKVKKSEAKSFLIDLERDSSTYREIFDHAYRKWDKTDADISKSLSALAQFKVKQQVPCVLSILRKYKQSDLKHKNVLDAIKTIEKFHFIFTAITSQRSSGGISQMYASLGRRINDSENAESAMRVLGELKGKLRDRIPSFEEFLALFSTVQFTSEFTKQRRLVRYILSQIDEYENQYSGKHYDSFTIEHLVPQSNKDHRRVSRRAIGQLGNLVMIPKNLNEKLKNKSFTDKKAILSRAKYNLPDLFISADELTTDLIVQRTKELAVVAYNHVWRI